MGLEIKMLQHNASSLARTVGLPSYNMLEESLQQLVAIHLLAGAST